MMRVSRVGGAMTEIAQQTPDFSGEWTLNYVEMAASAVSINGRVSDVHRGIRPSQSRQVMEALLSDHVWRVKELVG
jgi:hypothetical protein